MKRDQQKELELALRASQRFDAGETAFITRELLQIKAELYNVEYPNLKALALFPVATDNDPAAEAIAFQGFDKVGRAKIIANDAKDLPRVDVMKGEAQTPVRTVGAEYGFSWLDLQRAAKMRVPLSTLRAMAARDSIAVGIDDVSSSGDADSGLIGAVNAASVGINAATGNWAGLTPAQVYADMVAPIQTMPVNTKDLHRVTDLILPISSYAYVETTPWNAANASNLTILGYFRANNPGVRVSSWYKLETAGAAGVKRMISYDRNPRVIEVQVPLDFYELPPQPHGLSMDIPCIARVGGVQVRFPKGVQYTDGI